MKCCNRWILLGVLIVQGTVHVSFPNIGWSQSASSQEYETLTEEQVLARFAHEPTVQEAQDAAIRYYQVHPDRIRSLLSSAQLKALVPTVSGEFSNDLTSSSRLMNDGLYPDLSVPGSYKENERVTGDRRGFRVQASWGLDRLVFNAEVLDVQSLIGILDGVVREVTTVYYIRRRLQIDMLLRPPPDVATRISQRIRIDELTGLLDAMTGGFMSRSVKAKEKNVALSGGVPSIKKTVAVPFAPKATVTNSAPEK